MTPTRHVFLILAVSVLTFGSPASAASDIAEDGISQCNINAWATDHDPAGLNIRSGPGSGYPVIGTIPPPRMIGSEKVHSDITVTGSKDGWFRISDASFFDFSKDHDEEEIFFKGEGWVSGRYVGFSVEGVHLFEAPSGKAPVAADFAAERIAAGVSEEEAEYFVPARVLACTGHWVEVGGTLYGKPVRGWTDDICHLPVTTCP